MVRRCLFLGGPLLGRCGDLTRGGVDAALRLVWQFSRVMTRILHVLDHSLPAPSGYTFRPRALMQAQAAKGWAVAGVTGVRTPDSGGKPGETGREAGRERGGKSV